MSIVAKRSPISATAEHLFWILILSTVDIYAAFLAGVRQTVSLCLVFLRLVILCGIWFVYFLLLPFYFISRLVPSDDVKCTDCGCIHLERVWHILNADTVFLIWNFTTQNLSLVI